MDRGTLGSRLSARMAELDLHAAEVARRAKTSEATVSNWCTDKVRIEHVKASQLMNIADAVDMDARELLLGEPRHENAAVHESSAVYPSQDLQPDALKLAFQLATEVSHGLSARGLALPPEKLGELTQLAYELLIEGLPRAKVLRFVLAAAG